MQLMCVTSSLFKLKQDTLSELSMQQTEQVETCKDAFEALLTDGSAFSC